MYYNDAQCNGTLEYYEEYPLVDGYCMPDTSDGYGNEFNCARGGLYIYNTTDCNGTAIQSIPFDELNTCKQDENSGLYDDISYYCQ